MRFLFAFISLISTVLAQQPQTEPPKKARMEGLVVSITGEPLPRAQVRLTGAPSLQGTQVVTGAAFAATSDDAGKFAIEDIDPGRNYQLTAQRTGYVGTRYGARSSSSPPVLLALESGQALRGVTLTMTPQGVISGRVVDALGDPQQGAIVRLLRRGYQRGVRSTLAANTAQTNDQGEFRIANLAPGRYYLVVQDRTLMQGLAPAGASLMSLPTYYPNSIEFQGAAPLDVAAGQELRGIEIRFRQGKVYTIRGKIVGPDGAAVPQGTFLRTIDKGELPDLGLIASQAQVRPDGTFELRGVAPGAYTLLAVNSQPNASRAAGKADVSVTDSDVSGIVVPMRPAAVVSGTVMLEGGDLAKLLGPSPANAQQAAALAVLSTSAGVAVNGARAAVALSESGGQPTVSPVPGALKDDGSFIVEGVVPSKYLLNVPALPPGIYVKSARLNGTDVTNAELDLTQSSGGTLQIVLSNKAADVTGAVRNEKGESVAGVIVSLWSRDPDRGNLNNGVRTATSDQNGTFQFQNLRPGTYYAAAWDDIDSGLALTRDFVTLLTSDATKLELTEGSHAAAELKLIPVAKIKAAEEKLP